MQRRDFLRGILAAGTVAITHPATAQTKLLNLKDYIRFRFCRPSVHLRSDIYTLMNHDPNHPIIASYRSGVAAMKALPDSNPTSWAYQANIHGTSLPFAQWPAGAPFATCEHGSDYFLSWHRIYLYFFEKIVRKHSGNNNFALPYWNYSKAGQAALPLPFRSPTGAGNALYNGTRANSVNAGNPLAAGTVNIATALSKASLLGGGQFQSSLEGTPHGAVHVAIGGNMGAFSTAGRDPIFWLHHCNIDRLWEKWLSLGNGHANPIGDAAWMAETAEFVDENGNFVTMVNSDILDTAAQLKYQYEDPRECIPLLVANAHLSDLIRRISIKAKLKYILRKDWKIDLAGKATRLDLSESDQRGEVTAFLRAGKLRDIAKSNRIMLRFGGLRLRVPMNGYFEAYLTVGPKETFAASKPVFIGNINTFGADAESQASMMQSPKMQEKKDHEMGVSTSIDVTDVLLKQVRGKGDTLLAVTLNPVSGVEKDEQGVNREAEPVFGEVALDVLPIEAK